MTDVSPEWILMPQLSSFASLQLLCVCVHGSLLSTCRPLHARGPPGAPGSRAGPRRVCTVLVAVSSASAAAQDLARR